MRTRYERTDFTSTSWTLVDAARGDDAAERRRALDEVYRRYAGPVYQFLRREGYAPERAADLTQDFFVHRIVEGRVLQTADPDRGSLRALMLTSVRNLCRDRGRSDGSRVATERAAALRRSEETEIGEEFAGMTAEDAFNARAALRLINDAVADAEAVVRSSRVPARWDVFERLVLSPLRRGARSNSHADVAREFGIRRVNQIGEWKEACMRILDDAIRARIATEVADPDDVPAEVAALLRHLRPAG